MHFYYICCHTRGHPKPARNPRVRMWVQKCTRGSTSGWVFSNPVDLTAGGFSPNPHPRMRVPSLRLPRAVVGRQLLATPRPAPRLNYCTLLSCLGLGASKTMRCRGVARQGGVPTYPSIRRLCFASSPRCLDESVNFFKENTNACMKY